MIFKDNEIWNKVIELEGKTLLTYVKKKRNTIVKVENKNNDSDQVIILDRKTYPIKEDIIAAYNILSIQGKLNRIPDLQWLAKPDKKVSSIVFRIIGEISKDHSNIEYSKRKPIIILKK